MPDAIRIPQRTVERLSHACMEETAQALRTKLAAYKRDSERLDFVMAHRAEMWNTEMSSREQIDAVMMRFGA